MAWKDIWEKKEADFGGIDRDNVKEVFLELKRSNGFDVVDGAFTYESFLQQYTHTKDMLGIPSETGENTACQGEIQSVYEIGCGSGANLYLFQREGFKVGGCDYSQSLIRSAKNALAGGETLDITCGEAKDIEIEPVYDSVFSNSVFSYFPDEEYALQVLEIMYKKARYSIGILDVHDRTKKEAFTEYRRKIIEDYDERYAGLPKYFYEKSFFADFAAAHNMDIQFCESDFPGYWNNEFIFNCYMYKK